jgi:hypothetical protein
MTDQHADDKTPRQEAEPQAKPLSAGHEAAPAKARPPRPSRAAQAAAKAAPVDAAAASDARPAAATGRTAPRTTAKGKAQPGTSARDKQVRRFLLRLSLANWAIAIVAWTISAALGITSPASIIVYSVLFVIGLVAAIVAILTYLLEKFGHEVEIVAPIAGGEGGSGEDPAAGAKRDTAAPAAT